MLYNIARVILTFLFKILFRMSASGCENIPKNGGFILASNHTSYLDSMILGVACPRRLDYMAKQELFKNLIFARLLFRVGAFPIKRDSADASALKEAIRRLRSGRALVLFPEGSRRFDGTSYEPQPGIGFLAAKSEAVVIPAFIKGSGEALPKGAKFIRPNKISVHFGQQIYLERSKPYSEIANEVMAGVNSLS